MRSGHLSFAVVVLCALTVCAAVLASDKPAEVALATVNSDFVAENQWALARQTAAGGDYEAATHLYLTLAERYGGHVVACGERLYRPLWRQVLDDVAAWPKPAADLYRRAADQDADARYARAAATGDLAALEQLVEVRLMSPAGTAAAVALADRLLEAGDFALAFYYYHLVLDQCPDAPMARERLLTKAFVAATLAGFDGQAVLIREQLQGRTAPLLGQDTEAVLRRMADRARHDAAADTAEHQTLLPTCEPAAVAWVHPMTTQPIRSRYPLTSTAAPLAAYRRGQLAVTFQTSLWLLDAATARTLWRYDADGRTGNAPPVHYLYEQAHRPVFGDDAILSPLSCGGRTVVGGQLGGVVNLVALRPSDGALLWQWNPWGEHLGSSPMAVDSMPATDTRRVFVPLATMTDLFGEVHVAAVDRLSGRLLWQRGLGAHNNQLPPGRWSLPSMPLSTGLALHHGLLVSCGGGLVTVQSAVSGTILWQRQVPQRTDFNTRPSAVRHMPGMVFNGQVNGRRPPALVRGRYVIAGDASTAEVLACDLLSGRLVWAQPADDAAQLLAADNERLYTWGRTLMARDLRSGSPLWRLALQEQELIAATPLVTPTDVYVATDRQLLIVRRDNGAVRQRIAWPPDRGPGELLLLPEGLLVLEPQCAVLYEPWPATRSRLEHLAAADPADAAPLIDLGRTAMRLDRRRETLDALARAQQRLGNDTAASVALFALYDELLASLADDARAAMAADIIDRMARCAATPETVARQALLESDYYAATNPHRAAAALHRALACDDVRRAAADGDQAGIVAERRIRKLAAIHGKELLAPFERQAAELRQLAATQPDAPAALHEAALRFAATDEALRTLEAEVAEYEKTGRTHQAIALLERLIRAEPSGPAHWRRRLALANLLIRTDEPDRARLQAETVLRWADAGASDPDADRSAGPDPATVEAARALLARLGAPVADVPRPVRLGQGPFEPAWQFDLPKKHDAGPMPVADRRCDNARATQPLFAATRYALVALDRADGKLLWQRDIDLSRSSRVAVPLLLLDRAVVVGAADRVTALDPADGRLLWETVFRQRPQVFEPSLLVALWHGSEVHTVPRTFQVTRLDRLGGMILVETPHTQHLLAPEDGYITATIDVPRNSRDIAFLPMAGPLAVGTVGGVKHEIRAWDLVAGVPLKGLTQRPSAEPCGPGGAWHEVLAALPGRKLALADLRAGTIRWESPDNAPPNGRFSACRLGNVLLVGTWDSRLLALRAADGAVAWSRNVSLPKGDAFREIVAVDGDALVHGEQWIARVGADGKIRWQHTCSDGDAIDRLCPARDRVLLIGRRKGPKDDVAFLQTIGLTDGKADARTDLSADESPHRITVTPAAGGLLVVGPQAVRFYVAGPSR
jgi:outer membrane protein assembly factor BamB